MVAGVMLLSYTAVSCTNDYFLDENNCWLYVPEIQKGSIPDFTAVFHGESGNHLITRKVSAPFDRNELMQNGILRFKLQPGPCTLTAFAQTGNMQMSEGLPLADSYISAPLVPQTEHAFGPCGPLRVLQCQLMLYPIGHPDSQNQHTIDINGGQLYTGTIVHEFRDLPAQVTRIDIRYTGLSTRLGFNGLFGDESPDDYTLVSYAVGGQRAVTHSFQDMYLPSSGTRLDGAESELTPLKLDVLFYAGEAVIGHFSDEISDPVEENAATVSGKVYLRPRHTLKFEYKGFTITGISLVGWEGMHPGDITPM